MNEEAMRKHYERTPKETLINILISSREQVEKLQKRNKERKQEIERLNGALQTHEILLKSNVLEIERLNNIIDKAIELTENILSTEDRGYYQLIFKEQLKVLKGEDKE